MAVGNATKNSSMTQISQSTLEESSQSVKTTIIVNNAPVGQLNPLPVDITDAEIAVSLNKESDSISVFQGESSSGEPIPWKVDSVTVFQDSYVTASISISNLEIEAKAASSRLSNRKMLSIHNYGPNPIYIGPTGVTPASGRPIYPNQWIDISVGDLGVYVVASESGNSIIVQEIG
jgi:hypothetical protein